MEKHFLIADPSTSTSATASAHEHVPESQSQGRSPQANHMYVPPVQYELPPYYPQAICPYPYFRTDPKHRESPSNYMTAFPALVVVNSSGVVRACHNASPCPFPSSSPRCGQRHELQTAEPLVHHKNLFILKLRSALRPHKELFVIQSDSFRFLY
ncbi:hypothetical protein F2Q68_00010481 [Brassica cretica]|uniref:Uncharacterized protein n=1 Tax=Brassica cretica TaxID=69181 RepID=A0A8S9KPP7_BRACR|nr:hypothetical protein F2Q68_00010481 [Brassica cretica]